MLHPVEEQDGAGSKQDLDQSSRRYRIGFHNTDPEGCGFQRRFSSAFFDFSLCACFRGFV